MRIVLLLISVIYTFDCRSQNLVPNSSFEEHTGCPKTVDQLYFCANWLNFRNTPDYFNSCSDFMSVPNNISGYQQAKDGEAYAGFSCFWTVNPDSREHIGIELIEPLQVGMTYYTSCWISKSDWPTSDIACNSQGIRFSTYANTNSDGSVLQNWDHIHNDVILEDSIGWFQIKGEIVADSAYSYLAIGNFYEDALTDTMHLGNIVLGEGYYYVDEVRLSTDSLFAYGLNNYLEQTYEVSVHPNPCIEELKISSNCPIESWMIFSTLGQIFAQGTCNSAQIEIDVSQIPTGSYRLGVNTCNNQFLNKSITILK